MTDWLGRAPKNTQDAAMLFHKAMCDHPKKDNPHRRHKCLGEITVKRDEMRLSCPLCGCVNAPLPTENDDD